MKQYLIGAALIGALGARAQTAVPDAAQPRIVFNQAPEPQKVSLKDCYQVVRGDSIRMFYDASYVLTPPACASIRRQVRVTGQGLFEGEVRDYWMDEATPAMRMRYANGKPEGAVEQFFRNGQRAVQGQFAQGQPSGDWQYWYPSGRPRQVLRFPAGGGFLIMAYWDSAGTQRTVDGKGYWEGTPGSNYVTADAAHWQLETRGLRFSGPLEGGLPHGQWQSFDTRYNRPFSAETFVRGKFRSGRLLFKPAFGNATVMKTPKVVLEVDVPGAQADRFQLGYSCADRARQQQRQEFNAAGAMPENPLKSFEYAERLERKLRGYSNQGWYVQLPARTAVVCGLDSLGNVSTVLAPYAPLRVLVKEAVAELPRWKPAVMKDRFTYSGFVVQVEHEGEVLKVQVQLTTFTGEKPLSAEAEQAYWQAVLKQETGS